MKITEDYMNGTYAVSFFPSKKLQLKNLQFDVFSSTQDVANVIGSSVTVTNDPTAIIKYVGVAVVVGLFDEKNGSLYELDRI